MTDKSFIERMVEFIKYHKEGDGECNTIVLVEWADRHNLSLQERYELSFYFSVTYSVVSGIVLFENREKLLSDIDKYAAYYKERIVFQSDRKYMRMKDSFEKTLRFWDREAPGIDEFLEQNAAGGVMSLEKAVKNVEKWEMFGRFSAFLFLECFANLAKIKTENTTIDWPRGNTATSGLLNLLCLDTAAELFDRKNKLTVTPQKMDEALFYLLDKIKMSGGSDNVTEVETSLCAYRKFYKASRYNGYYLDRMLEEINAMRGEYKEVCDEVLAIRAERFNKRFLGELGGWSGIRRELKKHYLLTGEINW